MSKKFKLTPDGAGYMYTYAATRKRNSVFRISAYLNDELQMLAFKQAVVNSYDRYPQFFMRLDSNFFTRKFKSMKKQDIDFNKMILEYDDRICRHFDITDKSIPVVRFICGEKKISAECFHGLADAPGLFSFLSYVLENYYKVITGNEIPSYQNEAQFELETKDVFKNLVKEKKKEKAKITNSNYMFAKQMQGKNYSITRIKMDTAELLAAAKANGMNLGAFLIATYMYSMMQFKNKESNKDITFVIPVGIRKFYGCQTTRNAALFLEAKQPHNNDASLEEVMHDIGEQMKVKGTKQYMVAVAHDSVKFSYWLLIRLVPEFIKRKIIRLISHVSENLRYTACVSNIGNLTFAPEVQAMVNSVTFSVPKLSVNGFLSTISSYNDTTTFEIASTGDGDFIIDKLIEILKERIDEVKIENYKYEY